MEIDKITSLEMEISLANFWGYRMNIIVPNVSWGAGIHECDLLIISKAGYATEVEIKVSKYDLINDFKKRHKHRSQMIKYFYYALPEYLIESCAELIPEHAGLISVRRGKNGYLYSEKIKESPKQKPFRKLRDYETLNIARLGTMRIWSLKEVISDRFNSQLKL